MKVRYLKSAAIVVEDGDSQVLCDPWLTDGAYYGSWCHYPPPTFEPEDFDHVDYIYISHIHPDHFDERTLRRMDADVPVLIHDYAWDYLRTEIADLGYEVVELPHDERTHLTGDLHINVLAADDCNPELCGNFFGCTWFDDTSEKTGSTQVDSMAVIDNGEHTVVDMNDCPYPMAERSMRKIKERYGDIDVVCHQYGAAQFYPQCMQDYSHEEKLEERDRVVHEKYRKARQFIDLFDPDYYLPFAGEYVLAGKLADLNRYKANPPRIEAYEWFSRNVDPDDHRCVFLNSTEYLDLDTGEVSKAFDPVDQERKRRYVREVLAERTFEYERDEMPAQADLVAYLPEAYERFEDMRTTMGYETDTTVLVSLPEGYVELSMAGEGYEVLTDADLRDYPDGYVKFELDPRLLKRIFEGPEHAHWADAKIGSHLGVSKQPDVYERGLYRSLSEFYAGG